MRRTTASLIPGFGALPDQADGPVPFFFVDRAFNRNGGFSVEIIIDMFQSIDAAFRTEIITISIFVAELAAGDTDW
jgi:hypothetical protein